MYRLISNVRRVCSNKWRKASKTELFNYPFPSQIYAVEMYSFYTQNTQMVGYQYINTIFCHVKVYVTKLPSTICTTIWVLKANTSKTEMRKTGRKIPPRNTILNHFHWNAIPIHIWPLPTSVLPSHMHRLYDSTSVINHLLTIGLQADVPKRKLPPWLNGHHAMQMYKGVDAHVWGIGYLSISIPHTPTWRGAGRSIGKVFQYVSRSKFCISSSHHPRITHPANHSLLYLTIFQTLGNLYKSLSSSIWTRKYDLFHAVWARRRNSC